MKENLQQVSENIFPQKPLLKGLIGLLFLFIVAQVQAQSLFWSILETDFNSYEEARVFIKAEDNGERIFSLLYTPQYLVYGTTSEESIEHPKIVDSWTVDELENAKHLPAPLRQYFERLYEEDERFETPHEHPHADSHLPTEDLEKGFEEASYPNQWNSERMVGLMTCTVFFVESDGSSDPDYYTWTAKALLEEKISILRSLHTWSYTAFRYGMDVTFIPQWLERDAELGQGREPNLHFGNFQTYSGQVLEMNKAILANLGYDEGFNV
ncbi:MAG: hypothetical protein KTR30_13840, partial [Saprospiraceae bacterium]|nr:hypothetical protein [Saprospiraceae bacterium]